MSAKKGITNTLAWILMGLLILGLGGFGVTNLSGSVGSVGRVGETEISLQEYARILQNEINAETAEQGAPVTFQDAREMGLDRRVLSQLVQAAAFEEETRLMGVSIGDAALREQILAIEAFQGVDGSFDRDAYRFALDRSGLSEAEFENDLRAEAARSLLQGAVLGGVEMPAAYADRLINHIGEERRVTFAVQGRAGLETGLPVPTEQDLVRYHAENEADFMTPRTRRITYAWLTPEMIIDTVQVDEATLREAYEDRAESFRQPERRLVERLVFATPAEAEAARARIEAGETGFEAEVAARGLTLSDIDLGDVARADLDAAAEAVFDAETGAVVGPVTTPLGPALFRVNAVLDAQTTTFAEAQPQLRDELASDRARRVIDEKVDRLSDLIAAGATLEELAEESEMQAGEIDWHPGMRDGIAAYPAFREAAQALSENDFPRIERLGDAGIFALRLDEIIEPQVQPLDEVRDAVEAGWRRQAVTEALRAQIEPQLPALRDGAAFTDLGLTNTTTLTVTRGGAGADTPPEFIDTVFGLETGDVTVLEGAGRIFVLRLDAISPPDPQDEQIVRLREAVREDAASGLAQDLFALLSADIRDRAGVEIDQQALNAVHSNMQ